jgi:hypothetical protein
VRRGHRLALGGCAAVEILLVAALAATKPTDGAVSVVIALLLAPVAVSAVAATARRLAGGWFPIGAAAVYVLLPLAATRFFLPVYHPVFDRHVLPALVGLQETWVFLLGVLIVAALSVLPRAVAAVAAVVAVIVALAVWGLGDLGGLRSDLHETAWSVTFPEWLIVASILGAMLRSAAIGGALGAVLAATLLHASHQPYDDGDFWRALGVAAPAAAVLVSSVALLVPPLRRTRAAAPAQAPSGH